MHHHHRLPPNFLEKVTSPDPKQNQTRRNGQDERPDWWATNPAPRSQWRIPSGRKYSEFFNPKTKAKNVRDWPLVPHHSTGRSKPVCIKYQVVGRCRPHCTLAHIRVADLSPDQVSSIDNKAANAYKDR